MLAKQLFEDIAAKLSETIANSPAKDLEKNAKAMLGGAFAKMDLVTREEFDIQQQILIKTRTKLSEVEARLAALENSLRPDAAPSADGDDDMAAPAALSDGVKSGDGNTP
ncbi:MAG: accessory factor UbiK family protein [Conchiformibius sp.]|nr:accessory factor UbiK family protein [Conchiformibius sp.]